MVKLKIGDADYHKYGKVIIEQKGNKYSITFPSFTYTNAPPVNKKLDYADNTIRKGTQVIFQLDNGKNIISQTQEDIGYEWRYWWHYIINAPYNNVVERTSPYLAMTYRYKAYLPGSVIMHNKLMIPDGNNVYGDIHSRRTHPYSYSGMDNNDLYGEYWQIRANLTPSDMLELSKHRIIAAYVVRVGKNQYLPIKHKQSKKIKKSIAILLHK